MIPRSIKNKTHKSCHSAAFRLDRGRPASYAGGRLAPLAGGLGVGADVLLLRRARPKHPAGRVRRRLASEVVRDVRALDRRIAELDERIAGEVEASGTMLSEIFGVGPILAAKIMGIG